MNVGKKVIKNPLNWVANAFDSWGRGLGIGTIVQSPEGFDDVIDVRWPKGRCFEDDDQIILEEDGKFYVSISHEEIQNLHAMKTLEAEDHLEFYYGWKPEVFESVEIIGELSTSPKLVLKIKS